jgi:peptidoglycan hydrolase-like protein with peptidoglycan-binding domain
VRTVLLTVAVVLAALTMSLLPVQAEADTKVMPGDFTGYAFDACDAPSQRTMDRWRTHSKYWGIGIYIAGLNRACDAQPNLTRSWVGEQSRKGWHLLPLVVGRQASCSPKGYYVGKRISADPDKNYAEARSQGRSAAKSGVRAARDLGIARKSVLWFDLEHFDTSVKRCRLSALAFTSGWSNRLHDLGYRSGFYSSASSGITVLDRARRRTPKRYTFPDYLWIAEWNGRDTVRSDYIGEQRWWPHRRVHQYRGGHDERHGGARLNVDSNFMSTGRGTVAGRPDPSCGVRISFSSYPRLERGERGDKVRAAQCLLRQRDTYDGKVDGRFDRATAHAVRRFQRQHDGLPTSGELGARTWTSLLSQGPRPLVKFGSGGDAVRRLQRSLNAAVKADLEVDGVFATRELRAVKHYQRETGRSRTGVVTAATWHLLNGGRVARRMPAMTRSQMMELFDRVRRSTVIPFSSGVDQPN